MPFHPQPSITRKETRLMNTFQSADELLDFAIEREEESFAFYTDMANSVKSAAMRELFDDFAHEELGHKAKLLAMKKDHRLVPAERKIENLKIADYLVETKPGFSMEYPDALRLAMQREKAAFKLYTDLAALADEESLRDLLTSIAQEEARHKLRFEIEYDENVLKES
jgi:rubrerythrin